MSTPTNEQREPSGPPVTPLSKETRDAFLRDHLSFLLSHDAKPDVVKAVEEDDELTGLMVSVSAFMLGYERTVCDREDELSAALSRIEELAKERDTLVAAVKWALGEEGEFCETPEDLDRTLRAGRHALRTTGPFRLYWWRGELRQRAFPSDSASSQSAVENSAAFSSGANTP